MPFPGGWPPVTGTSRKTIRAYVEGITTTSYADNAYLFADITGLATCDKPSVWPGSSIRVFNDGTADVLVSFDGVNLHGTVKPGRSVTWEGRTESGIAVRSPSGPPPKFASFRIEAW